jgi:predicted N-formylglutamate amidohydrolase
MTRRCLLEPDEPLPCEVHNEAGRAPLVIVCDHAGHALPRALGDLGLSADDLRSHIAWDIGAAGVARRLGELLDAPVFLQRYSRLVIDCNRPLGAPDSIPEVSGGVTIPGNRGLGSESVEARIETIFRPYHARIAEHVASHSSPCLIAMHSFTPVLHGVARRVHAGVLYERDARLASRVLARLREEPRLIVGDNEPYVASAKTDYAIIEYGERRGAPYVELEVRQDLLAEAAGCEAWAERLAAVLRASQFDLPDSSG